MRDKVGESFDGTVTAVVGSGLYVSLDEPFVDVLVRLEGLGPDRYELTDDELSVVGTRSGDRVLLGERISVVIEDVSIVRRQVTARRVVVARAHGKRVRGQPQGRNLGNSGAQAKSRRGPKPRIVKPSRKKSRRG